MKHEEAMQHGLGYAAGREDASGTATACAVGDGSGFLEFAEAYATGWDRYNREAVHFMTNARSAYECWQASGGRTIYDLAHMSEYALERLGADGHVAAREELGRRMLADISAQHPEPAPF